MFDYELFAKEMTEQAKELVPNELKEDEKEYLINMIKKFVIVAGKDLYNNNKYTDEQKIFLCQVIAEWTFHKSIDLFKTKLSSKYYDSILQKIAFSIYETITIGFDKNISKKDLLNAVEEQVKADYQKYIKEPISVKEQNNALLFSNINKITEDNMLNKNKKAGMKTIQKIKNKIKILTNIKNLYETLKTDVVKIELGHNLLTLTNTESDSSLFTRLALLRKDMSEEFGYVIPYIKIIGNNNINDNQYKIFIHNNCFASGNVYPDKYMVIADQIKEKNINLDSEIIEDKDPTYNADVFWIKENIAINIHKEVTCVNPTDVLITHIREFLIEHVEQILTLKDAYSYVNSVKENYSKKIADKVLKLIDITEIRRVLSNLIREKISIKDIGYIFEMLSDYGRFTDKNYILSEKIRAALGQQIMNQHTVNGVLYGLTIGEALESKLINSVQNTELSLKFMLKTEEIESFVESVADNLMESHKKYNIQPVIIADPKIRLALYDLLIRKIQTIAVVSYSELTTNIEVKKVGTIE